MEILEEVSEKDYNGYFVDLFVRYSISPLLWLLPSAPIIMLRFSPPSAFSETLTSLLLLLLLLQQQSEQYPGHQHVQEIWLLNIPSSAGVLLRRRRRLW